MKDKYSHETDLCAWVEHISHLAVKLISVQLKFSISSQAHIVHF